MDFWLIKSTYIVGLLSLLIAKLLLPNFLQYGKTLKHADATPPKTLDLRLLYYTVPKFYFVHFYIISSCLSMLTLCAYPRYVVVWLLLCHSLRRLYETLFVSTSNKQSRMNWSHYLVGLWFYTTFHIILNIELYRGNIERHFPLIALIVLCIASWDQYENHKVLSRLVKYSLPQERGFRWVCCPHYTDEIFIYTTFLAASKEFLWPLIWVVACLSLSAFECQNYYIDRFGIRVPRWALLPYIL